MNFKIPNKLIVILALALTINTQLTFSLSENSDGDNSIEMIKLIDADSAENLLALAKEKEQLKVTRDLLEEKLTFPFDERFFLLYSFMNYTGYDAKTSDEYYPVREELRNELSRKSIQIKDEKYYKNRTVKTMENTKLVEEPLLYSSYVDFIHKAGLKYPSLTIMSMNGLDEIPYNNISDLPEHLYHFYINANIKSMIPKYKNYHEIYIDQIDEEVYSALSNMIITYNIKDIKETTIDVNLLEASNRGVSYISNDLYTKKASIHVGPSSDLNKASQTIVHEYLHQYVNPVVDRYDIKLISMNGEVRYPVEGIYNDKRSVIIESIVRVLDTLYDYDLYTKKFKEEIERLEDQGFVFSTETYDMLIKYDFEKGSLTEFLDKLMISYTGNDPGMAVNQSVSREHPINKLRFVYDEKVFTLFALINSTGFDEIVSKDMAQIRKNIRENISEDNVADFKDYYSDKNNDKNLTVKDFVNALSSIGPAPDFKLIDEIPNSLKDLPSVLRKFHKNASVSEMYEFYKKEQEKISDEFVNKSMLKLLMFDHNKFYDISFDEMKYVDITVNFLGNFDDGYISSRGDDALIVLGDSEVENGRRNIATLYKNYIKTTIDSVILEMESENKLIKSTNLAAKENTIAYERHGEDSLEYIKENLMYAIRISMIKRNYRSSLHFEYRDREAEGYMLVRAMCDRIKELNGKIEYEKMIEKIIIESYEGKLK